MSGCHVPAVGECACLCHKTGIKTMYSVNPPYPCCMCEAMTYGVISPVKQESDIEHLLKRIITLENFAGQNYKVDYKRLCDSIDSLSERITIIDKNIDDALAQLGQRQISDYRDLIDMIGNLSMRLNKLESSLREFEKQRVIPISKRVDALEEQQTKQEVRLCDLQDSWVNLMAERDTFANYMVDHEKRLYQLEEGECSGTLRTR